MGNQLFTCIHSEQFDKLGHRTRSVQGLYIETGIYLVD